MEMASLLPGTGQLDPLDFEMLVMSLVHLFNEALGLVVVQMPEVEERRLALVSSLVARLLEAGGPESLADLQR
jgi:hypothetical protein